MITMISHSKLNEGKKRYPLLEEIKKFDFNKINKELNYGYV